MDIANGSLAKSNNWSLINRKKTKKMLVNHIKKNTFAIISFLKFVLPISKETFHLL